MSVSEKLKALHARRDAETSSRAQDIESVLDALPEILEVVEAAEQIEQGPLFVGSRLPDALAALDKELP